MYAAKGPVQPPHHQNAPQEELALNTSIPQPPAKTLHKNLPIMTPKKRHCQLVTIFYTTAADIPLKAPCWACTYPTDTREM